MVVLRLTCSLRCNLSGLYNWSTSAVAPSHSHAPAAPAPSSLPTSVSSSPSPAHSRAPSLLSSALPASFSCICFSHSCAIL